MNIIDTIKQLETAGFTRKQAESQVQIMIDLKKDLATQKDVSILKEHLSLLQKNSSNLRDDLSSMQTQMNQRFELQDRRFEYLNHRIDLVPLKTTFYIAGIALTLFSLVEFVPQIYHWFIVEILSHLKK